MNRGLLDGLTDAQIAGVRHACETSHLYFAQFFFKARRGVPLVTGPCHKVVCSALERVYQGEITRLLVNIPPGYLKTELTVIAFVARGLALAPRSRYQHVSFDDTLVRFNSQAIRDTILTPEYQILWPTQIRTDSTDKALWMTNHGGMLRATSSGGGVTGFRAGSIGDEFPGAFLIDDPLKPDDASSDTVREFINDRYMSTFRSRLTHEGVPIVVDMQRIHPRDFSNHLLTGGGGEKFHHLMLPVEISRNKGYPTEYTHGIPIEHDLPDGPLWEWKHDVEQIDVLRRDGKVFSAQYMQDPRTSTNQIFSPTYFRSYELRPRTLNVAILCDPSMGKTKRSDRTAMPVIGVDQNANKYLLDGYCHRMNLSQRWAHLKRLYQRWATMPGIMNVLVGYERYGMQADLEYIQEQQQIEGAHFPIQEVGWVREGSQSKEDRIQRLEPDFKAAKFWLPCTVFRQDPQSGEMADCFWEGRPHGVELRRAWGKTSAQRKMAQHGESFRIVETLKRVDENGQLYDLTWLLMEELKDFPNATFKDLSDAASRIFDVGIIPAPKKEVEDVSSLNEQLVA